MVAIPGYKVYWRPANTAAFTDITAYTKLKELSYTHKLNDPLTFNLPVFFDKDSTPEDIQPGDWISITTDGGRYSIADKILVGTVDNPNKEVIGLDYVNYASDPYEFSYNLECLEWDFSEADVSDYAYKQESLSTILTDILNNYSLEKLGGVINSTTIAKYSLKCADITIDSFKEERLTCREAIDELCKQNGLYFKLIWYSQPDGTNTLKLAAQVVIFDKLGLAPADFFWSAYGVTDDTMKTGRIENPDNAIDSLLPAYLATYKKPRFREDKSNIRNYLIFTGNVAEAGAFDGTLSTLERYETVAKGVSDDVHYLPHPAYDIYAGGFLVRGYVTDATTPSTTQFSINAELQGSVVVGDKVVINQGTEITTVTNVSTNLITVSPAITTPSADDIFEVIQQDWITIYDENLEDTDYTSRGFAKDLKGDGPGKIRFLQDRSIPLPGTELVFYYWPAKPYKREVKIYESIQKYGIRRHELELKETYTKEQVDQILYAFQNQTTNKTLEIESYRPLSLGEIIPVDLTNVLTENLMVTEVRGQYLGQKRYTLFNLYDATLSTNNENFEDFLKRVSSKADHKPTGSNNKVNKVDEKINVFVNFTYEISTPGNPYLAKVYYLFDGNVNDYSGNAYNATLYGSASVSSGNLVLGNNATDYLDIPTAVISSEAELTFCGWVKIDTLHTAGPNPANCLIMCGNLTYSNLICLYYEPNSNRWTYRCNNNVDVYFAGSTVEDLGWHFILFELKTGAGSYAKLYLDDMATEIANRTNALASVNPTFFILGQESDSTSGSPGSFDATQSWAGKIDSFYVFDRILTTAEKNGVKALATD